MDTCWTYELQYESLSDGDKKEEENITESAFNANVQIGMSYLIS